MKRNSCLSLHASFPFFIVFLLGGKTMKLNNDAVAKRCCCKAMLLNNGAIR